MWSSGDPQFDMPGIRHEMTGVSYGKGELLTKLKGAGRLHLIYFY